MRQWYTQVRSNPSYGYNELEAISVRRNGFASSFRRDRFAHMEDEGVGTEWDAPLLLLFFGYLHVGSRSVIVVLFIPCSTLLGIARWDGRRRSLPSLAEPHETVRDERNVPYIRHKVASSRSHVDVKMRCVIHDPFPRNTARGRQIHTVLICTKCFSR